MRKNKQLMEFQGRDRTGLVIADDERLLMTNDDIFYRRAGLSDVIGLDWLRMFSSKELSTLIAGAEHEISVADLQVKNIIVTFRLNFRASSYFWSGYSYVDTTFGISSWLPGLMICQKTTVENRAAC